MKKIVDKMIDEWKDTLDISHWSITTERIDPKQVVYDGEDYLLHWIDLRSSGKEDLANYYAKTIRRSDILHTDETLMPQKKRAWSSGNSISYAKKTCITYWLNKLQNLKTSSTI